MGRKEMDKTHCRDCGVKLDDSNIFYNSGYKSSRCHECYKEDQKIRYRNLGSDSRVKIKVRNRNYRWTVKYKMSELDYSKLLVAQNGVCAICHQSCLTGKELSVDHNHTTGEIRGLLCQNCNAAIGYLKENPDFIMSAYEYLRRTTWEKYSIPQIRAVSKKEEVS